jgi:hypothetical protein
MEHNFITYSNSYMFQLHGVIIRLDLRTYENKHAVAQLVEALRYKPEGRGFDSRWCHWNFSLT